MKVLTAALLACLFSTFFGGVDSTARVSSQVRDRQTTARAPSPPPTERPDQKLDRLTAAINSGSLQGAALAQALRERAWLNATTGRLGFAHQDIDRLLTMDARDADAHLARGLAFLVGNQ